MSKKKSEPAEVLLSPEELETAHEEWDAQNQRIVELYQAARRDSNQIRANALWEGWQHLKCQERDFFAMQAELQRQADEVLPRKRQRRNVA